MVYSFVYSIVSLLWGCILMFFIMYFFAIVLRNGVVEYFKDNLDMNSQLSKDLITFFGIIEHFMQYSS